MNAPQYPDRKYIRWNGFDYTQSQNYFITIVVHERLHLLGEIYNEKIKVGNRSTKHFGNAIIMTV